MFLVEILKFFDADPGRKKFGSESEEKSGVCSRCSVRDLFGAGPGEEDEEGGEEHEHQLQEAPPRTRPLHRLSLLTHFVGQRKFILKNARWGSTNRGCKLVLWIRCVSGSIIVGQCASGSLGFDDRILYKSGAAWLMMVRRGSEWCGVAQDGAAWLSW
jgi:hypothetical protein